MDHFGPYRVDEIDEVVIEEFVQDMLAEREKIRAAAVRQVLKDAARRYPRQVVRNPAADRDVYLATPAGYALVPRGPPHPGAS